MCFSLGVASDNSLALDSGVSYFIKSNRNSPARAFGHEVFMNDSFSFSC